MSARLKSAPPLPSPLWQALRQGYDTAIAPDHHGRTTSRQCRRWCLRQHVSRATTATPAACSLEPESQRREDTRRRTAPEGIPRRRYRATPYRERAEEPATPAMPRAAASHQQAQPMRTLRDQMTPCHPRRALRPHSQHRDLGPSFTPATLTAEPGPLRDRRLGQGLLRPVATHTAAIQTASTPTLATTPIAATRTVWAQEALLGVEAETTHRGRSMRQPTAFRQSNTRSEPAIRTANHHRLKPTLRPAPARCPQLGNPDRPVSQDIPMEHLTAVLKPDPRQEIHVTPKITSRLGRTIGRESSRLRHTETLHMVSSHHPLRPTPCTHQMRRLRRRQHLPHTQCPLDKGRPSPRG